MKTTAVLKIFLCLSFYLYILPISAQLQLISGTSFDPVNPSDTNKTFWGVNDISYTGLQSGVLTITPPLVPNVVNNTFDATFEYGITNNPNKLDKTKYTSSTNDNMLVVSPFRGIGNANILSYKVLDLLPNSDVEIKVTFCNILNPNTTICTVYSSINCSINQVENTTNQGSTSPLIAPEKCDFVVYSKTSSYYNRVNSNGESTFNINTNQTGDCHAIAIKSIEIWGIPKPKVNIDPQFEICNGNQLTLGTGVYYNCTYKWEVNNGSEWNVVGANPSINYLPNKVGIYKFKVSVTNNSSTTTFVSDTAITNVINCCTYNGQVYPDKTIFYEDFGTLDLSDKSGKTYKVKDYSNYIHPIEIIKTTTTPFRWPLIPAPLNTVFKGTGAIQDGEHTVASCLTGNIPYNGYQGAMLDWSNSVLGKTQYNHYGVGYDHSGKLEGGVLLLNFPPSTKDSVFYSKEINLACTNTRINAQAWIAVFSRDASGLYSPVNIKMKLTEINNPSNSVMAAATATREADGGGFWVKLATSLDVVGTKFKFELFNNQDAYISGNDLALDDIRISACFIPGNACDLVTNQTDLEETTENDLYPNPFENTLWVNQNFTHYKLFDAQGVVILSNPISEGKIDLLILKSGFYFIELLNKDSKVLKKIIKK